MTHYYSREDIRKQIKSLKRELNNEKQNKEITNNEEPVDTKTEAVEEYVAEVQKYKTMKQQMPKKGNIFYIRNIKLMLN